VFRAAHYPLFNHPNDVETITEVCAFDSEQYNLNLKLLSSPDFF
jgi:hypothetical protein